MHDHQREPCCELVAEALRLQCRRRALVAEHLVVFGEAEVRELVGVQTLLRHRGFAQRGERAGIRAHDSRCGDDRCSSRRAR